MISLVGIETISEPNAGKKEIAKVASRQILLRYYRC
jgi:hypothetical protein